MMILMNTSYNKYLKNYADIVKSEIALVKVNEKGKLVEKEVKITVCEDQKLLIDYVENIF